VPRSRSGLLATENDDRVEYLISFADRGYRQVG
jgi:hypothetical protein